MGAQKHGQGRPVSTDHGMRRLAVTRKWIALPLLLLLPLGLSAQSFWDGDAAIQRGDAAFESGSYAASNSFSEGTQVVVQDLDTGKSTTVTISSRISGPSNVLMMLSPKA